MPFDQYPADRVPQKPLPETSPERQYDIVAQGFGRVVLFTESTWSPGELDRQYFEKLRIEARRSEGVS